MCIRDRKIACDLVDEGMRTEEEAVAMIDPRNPVSYTHLIEGEKLDLLIGNRPIEKADDLKKEEKDAVKQNVLNILKMCIRDRSGSLRLSIPSRGRHVRRLGISRALQKGNSGFGLIKM